MPNLNETPTWESGIHQWEEDEPITGGVDGTDNIPTRQLANRTLYLKGKVDSIEPITLQNASAVNDIQEDLSNIEGRVTALEGSQQAQDDHLATLDTDQATQNTRLTILEHGTVVNGVAQIKNKYVIFGLEPSQDSGPIITVSGGYALWGGRVIRVKDENILDVPLPEPNSGMIRVSYLVVKKSGENYITAIEDAESISTMTIARMEAYEDGIYTLFDVRKYCGSTSWAQVSPVIYIPIPDGITLQNNAYSVCCEIVSALNPDAVGRIYVYDRTINGFKLTITGTADEAVIRWNLFRMANN